jgi:hypothetical protein
MCACYSIASTDLYANRWNEGRVAWWKLRWNPPLWSAYVIPHVDPELGIQELQTFHSAPHLLHYVHLYSPRSEARHAHGRLEPRSREVNAQSRRSTRIVRQTSSALELLEWPCDAASLWRAVRRKSPATRAVLIPRSGRLYDLIVRGINDTPFSCPTVTPILLMPVTLFCQLSPNPPGLLTCQALRWLTLSSFAVLG